MRIELPQADPCDGCGACCAWIGLPPFAVPNPDLGPAAPVVRPGGAWLPWLLADTDTFLAMPAGLRADHAAALRSLVADPTGRPCLWLDPATRRCRHHDWRPHACRTFAAGAAGCAAARSGRSPVVWDEPAPPASWRNPRRPRPGLNGVPAIPGE
jgi:Fe-S-cluster containining protein